MACFADDSRMINKKMPKSLLLRDYLLDDMSSCSSNGFRSYPRRQCCTTVRFLVEIDLNKNSKLHPKQKRPSIAETKPKQSSVLQRASAVMSNAFKHFPFAGDRNSRKAAFLPRSLSRKLLKHGFWKKTDHKNEIKRLKSFGDLIKEKKTDHKNEIKRLKSFGDLIKEKKTTPPPSPLKFSTAVTTFTTTAELTSSTSNSNSESWSDSDFTTTTTDSFATGNSSDVNRYQNDVVNDLQENNKMRNENIAGATTTAMATTYSSTTGNAKEKRQEDQVEQFSPVSVMDFPSDDDNDVDGEDEVSSERKHLDVEGTKRFMHKTRRIKGVPQLEPVKLEDRMTTLVIESTHACYEFEHDDNQAEKKATALLQLMKSTISRHFFKYEAMENLLLGFFKERMLEETISDFEMLQTAREWMNDQSRELFLDWESQKNRQTYVKAMEKRVKWSNYDEHTQIKDIGLELEHEIFTSLVNDILLDFRM